MYIFQDHGVLGCDTMEFWDICKTVSEKLSVPLFTPIHWQQVPT